MLYKRLSGMAEADLETLWCGMCIRHRVGSSRRSERLMETNLSTHWIDTSIAHFQASSWHTAPSQLWGPFEERKKITQSDPKCWYSNYTWLTLGATLNQDVNWNFMCLYSLFLFFPPLLCISCYKCAALLWMAPYSIYRQTHNYHLTLYWLQ